MLFGLKKFPLLETKRKRSGEEWRDIASYKDVVFQK
jgi:hypothetical protein